MTNFTKQQRIIMNELVIGFAAGELQNLEDIYAANGIKSHKALKGLFEMEMIKGSTRWVRLTDAGIEWAIGTGNLRRELAYPVVAEAVVEVEVAVAEPQMTTEQVAVLEEVAILYYNEKTAEPIIQTREAHNSGRSQVKISRELAEGLRDLGYLGSHFHSFWLTAKGCEWAGNYWKAYRAMKATRTNGHPLVSPVRNEIDLARRFPKATLSKKYLTWVKLVLAQLEVGTVQITWTGAPMNLREFKADFVRVLHNRINAKAGGLPTGRKWDDEWLAVARRDKRKVEDYKNNRVRFYQLDTPEFCKRYAKVIEIIKFLN